MLNEKLIWLFLRFRILLGNSNWTFSLIMEINFQNALILSFRKLFQYFQKIWQVNTNLFPKIKFIFWKCQLLPLGSQKWISKSGPKCGANCPPTWSGKFGFLEITKNVGGVGKFWMVVATIFYDAFLLSLNLISRRFRKKSTNNSV